MMIILLLLVDVFFLWLVVSAMHAALWLGIGFTIFLVAFTIFMWAAGEG